MAADLVIELVLLTCAAFVFSLVVHTVLDYFDYKRGRVGWTVLPWIAQCVWRSTHPTKPIEFQRNATIEGK
jgi:hypothetical protein